MDGDDRDLLERIQHGDAESFGILTDRTRGWLLDCVITSQVGRADAEKALADALGAASPDPRQLGTLLLKVKALRDRAIAAQEAFTTAVKALLTTAQQQKINDILNLEKLLSAAPVPHSLG
ncbi:MAG: hypothetical protein ACHQQS_01175 [Thermoanaerobaculales bacterium]